MFSKMGEWIQEFLCTGEQGPKRHFLNYQVMSPDITLPYSMTPVKSTQCTQLPEYGSFLALTPFKRRWK